MDSILKHRKTGRPKKITEKDKLPTPIKNNDCNRKDILKYRKDTIQKKVNRSVQQVQLYTPHKGQRKIHQYLLLNPDTKFIILNCGRRFGKSFFASNQALFWALSNPNVAVGYVTPSYKLAKYIFELVCSAITEKFPFLKKQGINKSDLKITFTNNSYIEFVSAGEGAVDNLRGRGYRYGVIDEAAQISDDAWNKVLRPIFLLAKQVILCSTPLGKGSWYYQIFQEGLKEEQTKYKSFIMGTASNPLVPPEELEDMKKQLPDNIYKQEVLAEFLDDGEGSVFKNINDCIIDSNLISYSGKYVAGLDIGRAEDYTVLSIIDLNTHQLVYQNRWNKMDYNAITKAVAAQLLKWNPVDCWVETNSIGDFFFDSLKEKYKGKLSSFYTLNKNKQQIIESLIVDFETEAIKIINSESLLNELKTFGIEFSKKNRSVVYRGMHGAHDDCVMSLAFANAAYHQYYKRSSFSYYVGNKH